MVQMRIFKMAKVKSSNVFNGQKLFLSEPQSVVIPCLILDKERPRTVAIKYGLVFDEEGTEWNRHVFYSKALLLNIVGTKTSVRVPNFLFHGGHTRLFKSELEAKVYSESNKVNPNMESFFDIIPIDRLFTTKDIKGPGMKSLVLGIIETAVIREDDELANAMRALLPESKE